MRKAETALKILCACSLAAFLQFKGAVYNKEQKVSRNGHVGVGPALDNVLPHKFPVGVVRRFHHRVKSPALHAEGPHNQKRNPVQFGWRVLLGFGRQPALPYSVFKRIARLRYIRRPKHERGRLPIAHRFGCQQRLQFPRRLSKKQRTAKEQMANSKGKSQHISSCCCHATLKIIHRKNSQTAKCRPKNEATPFLRKNVFEVNSLLGGWSVSVGGGGWRF
jgi:hypothetical protein